MFDSFSCFINASITISNKNYFLEVKDLAKKIGREMNVAVLAPNSGNSMKGAPNFVGLNLSKIEDEFLITKYIDLHQGLINTIEWIKNYE